MAEPNCREPWNMGGGHAHGQYLLLVGRAGGQIALGGIAAGENLVLGSTIHATKGLVQIQAGSPLAIHDGLFHLSLTLPDLCNIIFDAGDYWQYNRTLNSFVFAVASVQKFSYDGAANEMRFNAASRFTAAANNLGSLIVDTRDAGAGKVARIDLISHDAMAGVHFYRKSATDTRIKFAWELPMGVGQDPDFNLVRFTGAIGAEVRDIVLTVVNATGNIALSGDKWLSFRGDDQRIVSPAANELDIVSIGGGLGTLRLTSGSVHIATWAGAKIGFFGTAPAERAPAYTPTNVIVDRSYNADITTIDEVADVLGTLISDLQSYGLLQ